MWESILIRYLDLRGNTQLKAAGVKLVLVRPSNGSWFWESEELLGFEVWGVGIQTPWIDGFRV